MKKSFEIAYSKEMPETSAEPREVDGYTVYQYVLRCYDAAGNASYYSGYYNDEWTRDEIKAFLYEEAVRQGCNDCACTLL